jgi:uncharacterized membrane protein
VSDATARLGRTPEGVLTAGLALSAALLVAGLALGSEATLRTGVVLLILTPVARVLAVAAGFLYVRDWAFAVISLAVLGVLASSAWISLGVAG